MLIHISFPFLVIVFVLHLLNLGMERRGKKQLGPGVVAAISDIEGGLVAATALPETGNARPSDGDGTSARGERGAGFDIGER